MRSRRARSAWIVPSLAALGVGAAAALILSAEPVSFELLASIVPAAVGAATLFLVPATRTRGTYYAVQAFAIVCYLLTLLGTNRSVSAELILLFVFMADLVLSEPYPLNVTESIVLVVVSSALRALEAGRSRAEARSLLEYHLPFLVSGLVVAVFGGLMTRYRELVVDLTASREQLAEAVVDLARANTAYQDYAVDARERATEMERQRITRDIHDIVGYTLTNNMMLMEAALDLMKENALALPAIIETARSNAQEGLDQVRSAMYKLREQVSAYPTGLNAIARLLRIFEQATAIRIHCDFSNMPSMISDGIDSAIYHLVQEALVNSFRHGKATEVQVRFWYSPETVRVSIRDNGVGGFQVEEGIGLRGMRERIEGLGGTVRAAAASNGFQVAASIPVEARRDVEQTAHTHR